MTQIRETIESLCIVLKCNGISEITAETFRLAKFDNPDTTKPMWLTLKNLLVWLETTKKFGKTFDSIGDNNKFSGEPPAIARYCKHEMFSRGYRLRSFFVLPENMVVGSREVLLAIGWLMAKENLIEKFASRAHRKINDDLPFRESQCAGITSAVMGDSQCLRSQSKFTNENKKLLYLVEGITFLKGKLDAACRSLLAAKNEYAHLLTRIHTSTLQFPQKSMSSNHLSALDVYLLNHEKEFIKHQEGLEYENLYLKSLILLRDKESSFWKWMESTLDVKSKSSEENLEEGDSQESLTLNKEDHKPSKEVQGIKTQQVEFTRLLQKQENLYTAVSTKWKRYKNAVEESQEVHEEFHTLLSCLDQDVLAELESIEIGTNRTTLVPSTERKSSWTQMQLSGLQGPLKLDAPCLHQKKKHRHADTPTHEQSAIARVTQELSENDALLKEELLKLKKENNDRILQVSLTLQDVVCIPPNPK
jgi:hypothetical protein